MHLKDRVDAIIYAGMGPEPRFTDPSPNNPRHPKAGRIAKGILITAACVVVLAGVSYGLSSTWMSTRPVKRVPIPDYSVDMAPRPALDLTELKLVAGKTPELIGAVRNVSQHAISGGRVTFELQDRFGQFAGNVDAEVKATGPGILVPFHVPITQPDAVSAIVTAISVQ